MKTSEELGEFKTADVPYLPTMDEALAYVKKPSTNSFLHKCVFFDHLVEYCDADKVERLLKLLCESNSNVEIQEVAFSLRNLMNDEWKERAEKYRDSFMGVRKNED